ncbi:UDP-forming cellulose synthase catalytic subunit [Roseibacterium sp. SDUM158017]|uniref:UDP-forming cellulose synthase catalytic subunit n=1 Tax=Roseicyclus salinarum TaxID=3036773 RepID=UPI0024155893|nr:UDP-forming cellulose synthase catalytic subunit [Roseibacterium sp. SDUM158017]MDG4649219.1 UDP-forming cellulose synthase catalytic subunit [Roseibacterium sp. SDUM158017]
MSAPRQKTAVAPLALGTLWALLLVPIALVASLPTSTDVQALLGLVGVLLVAALKPFTRKSLLARLALLAVASLLVLRYWIWRLLETLPSVDAPLSLAAALLLFAVETYAIAIFFLTAFINADPRTRPMPKRVHADKLPTVDVLVPSYNEPSEMLSVTLSAAKHIYYPREKLRVVLCDDGGTDQRCNHSDPKIAEAARARRAELQKLCRELDVIYSTRARNEHAKAGNMSAALSRLDGELVVVFDADHVPSRDFLARTVGYFVENPRLFLVQTPHFFLNSDPIERNLGLAATCPAENEMFYTDIHRGLDRWKGAFFCGSAALLRRKALNEAGGFSGETITEDAETALDIHARGWESLYVNRAMIAGLQPETFASFIQQRGRWATGMIQMLLLKNPLFRPGLKLAQRLCYINSMSFWLFPLVRLSFMIIPLFYLFFGLEIFVATGQEVLAYAISYLVVSFMVQNALFARVRWPLISEVYEVAQAPYLATQIFKTILRPRAAKFAVTAKDETLAEDFISPIYAPLLILFLIMAAGVAAAGLRWFAFPGDRGVIAIVGAWAVFNLLLTSLALRSVAEKQQRRSVPRVAMDVPATAWRPNADGRGPDLSARISDASTSGLRLELETPPHGTPAAERLAGLTPGEELIFRPRFPEAPDLEREIRVKVQAVINGAEGIVLGLRYVHDQPMSTREAVAYLIFNDSENWRRRREDDSKPRGLIAGLLYVLWLSVMAIPRTFADFAREPGRRRRKAETTSEEQVPVHLLAFGADFDAGPSGNVAEARDTSDGLDFIVAGAKSA